MNEEEARRQVAKLVGEATMARLDQLVRLVVEETGKQNLVARSTVEHIWQRHVLDSIQLIRLAPIGWTSWLDIGTGGGFPGLAIACCSAKPVILVEPRRLRAEFLARACLDLRLSHARVVRAKVEQTIDKAAVISARAVASPFALIKAARHCATDRTVWLLPSGAVSDDQVEQLQLDFPEMVFHVEHSLSNPTSRIIVAQSRSA